MAELGHGVKALNDFSARIQSVPEIKTHLDKFKFSFNKNLEEFHAHVLAPEVIIG
jgi:hypothetical protein